MAVPSGAPALLGALGAAAGERAEASEPAASDLEILTPGPGSQADASDGAAWRTDRVVLVATPGSSLRAIDLSRGRAPVLLPAEPGPVRDWALEALGRRGLVDTLGPRARWTPGSVAEGVAASNEPVLGITLASDAEAAGLRAIAALTEDEIEHKLRARTPRGHDLLARLAENPGASDAGGR